MTQCFESSDSMGSACMRHKQNLCSIYAAYRFTTLVVLIFWVPSVSILVRNGCHLDIFSLIELYIPNQMDKTKKCACSQYWSAEELSETLWYPWKSDKCTQIYFSITSVLILGYRSLKLIYNLPKHVIIAIYHLTCTGLYLYGAISLFSDCTIIWHGGRKVSMVHICPCNTAPYVWPLQIWCQALISSWLINWETGLGELETSLVV